MEDRENCRDPGSSRGPSDLQSDAFPSQLSRLCQTWRLHRADIGAIGLFLMKATVIEAVIGHSKIVVEAVIGHSKTVVEAVIGHSKTVVEAMIAHSRIVVEGVGRSKIVVEAVIGHSKIAVEEVIGHSKMTNTMEVPLDEGKYKEVAVKVERMMQKVTISSQLPLRCPRSLVTLGTDAGLLRGDWMARWGTWQQRHWPGGMLSLSLVYSSFLLFSSLLFISPYCRTFDFSTSFNYLNKSLESFPNISRRCIFFFLALSLSLFYSSFLLFSSLLFMSPNCRKFGF